MHLISSFLEHFAVGNIALPRLPHDCSTLRSICSAGFINAIAKLCIYLLLLMSQGHACY